MPIAIRKMRAADLAPVTKLLEYWHIAPIAPTKEMPVTEREELVIGNALVAVDGERVVGVRSFIQRSPTLGEGASLAIDPAYKGRGIGEMLQVAGYRDMYQRGIRTIRSEADRPEFIRFLIQRFGYRTVGTKHKLHAFGCPDVDHWSVLELDLDSLPELQDLRNL